MTNKNAPCWQSGGSNGGIRDSLRKEDITPNRRAAQCFLCRFYAEICLKTGHVRRLCRLTGEKNPNAGMAGCVFERGVQGDLGGLTEGGYRNNLNVPNRKRLGNGLSGIPNAAKQIADKKTTAIHSPAVNFGKGMENISRIDDVRYPRGPAASFELGSVIDPAFCFNNPKSKEV